MLDLPIIKFIDAFQIFLLLFLLLFLLVYKYGEIQPKSLTKKYL